jgi:hypothetical protein
MRLPSKDLKHQDKVDYQDKVNLQGAREKRGKTNRGVSRDVAEGDGGGRAGGGRWAGRGTGRLREVPQAARVRCGASSMH